MGEQVFFSVIVVSLNAEKLIGMTLHSALSQSCRDFEIIVKDGCSKDGTLNQIPEDLRIKVISKKDNSLYDAMNQAVEEASGRYSIFMNCGDIFASDNVLETIKKAIGETEYSFVYGDYSRDGIVHCQPQNLTPFYLYRTPLCHQTVFFHTALLQRGRCYDTKYKILADYDLTLRLFAQGVPYYVNEVVCAYLGGGISETPEGIAIRNTDRKQILSRRFSKKDRIRYAIQWQMTLPWLRSWLADGRSPAWIRQGYQRIVNRLNR